MGKIQFLVFANFKHFVHFCHFQTPHRHIVNISVNNFAEESEAIRALWKLLQNLENLFFVLKDYAEAILPTLSAAAKSIGVGGRRCVARANNHIFQCIAMALVSAASKISTLWFKPKMRFSKFCSNFQGARIASLSSAKLFPEMFTISRCDVWKLQKCTKC